MKIKNKFSDVEAEVDNETGWIILTQYFGNEDEVISIGTPPNARTEVIEKAIKKSLEIQKRKNNCI